jgi:hypothetical protein
MFIQKHQIKDTRHGDQQVQCLFGARLLACLALRASLQTQFAGRFKPQA